MIFALKWSAALALACTMLHAEPAVEANVDPEANTLVVSFSALSPDVAKAIQKTAGSLGGKVSFLSIVENGGLDLQRDIRTGNASNLIRQLKGGTLVLINSETKTRSGEPVRPEDFLKQGDLIKALEAYGVRVAVVNPIGNDITRLVQQRMIPTDGTVEKRYASPAAAVQGKPADATELDETLELSQDFIERRKYAQERFDPTRQTGMVFVNGDKPYEPQSLAEQARQLQKDIEASIPGRRVVTVPLAPIERAKPDDLAPLGPSGHYKHGDLADIFSKFDRDGKNHDWRLSHPPEVLAGKQHHQGTILVMPAPSDSNINIVVTNAATAEIGKPAFYESERFQLLLVNGMSTESKLNRLRILCSELDTLENTEGNPTRKLADYLVDGILADLAMEQASALKGEWKPGYSNETFLRLLPQLRELRRMNFTVVVNDGSDAAKVYARLLTGIEALGRAQQSTADRFWLNPLNPARYLSRAAAIGAMTKGIVSRLKTEVFGSYGARKPSIKSLLDEGRSDFNAKLEHSLTHYENTLGRPAAVQRTFVEPLSRKSITADTYYDFPRALSKGEWNEAVKTEEATAANRPKWLAGCAAQFAALE